MNQYFTFIRRYLKTVRDINVLYYSIPIAYN